MKRPALLLLLGLGALAALVLVLVLVAQSRSPDVRLLAERRPGETALMRQRAREARSHGRTPRRVQMWVPIEEIAPLLRRAVIVSEDASFYRHGGVDLTEMREAARADIRKRRIVRGGSTITQQLARNVYLGSQRTLLRKIEETLIAFRLERALSKRRILELYLNVIEWGDGVYGAEAAARTYFGVTARRLTVQQAAVLAALVPSPRRDDPARRPKRLLRRYRTVLTRLWQVGAIDRATYDSLRSADYVLRGERPVAPSPPPALEGAPAPPDTAAVAPPETVAAPSDSNASSP